MLPSPAPHVCRVILLRHGATDFNLRRPAILQGRSIDLGLSEEGRRQARKASDLLASWKLERIYASELKRARETAELVAAPHGLTVESRAPLCEVDVGRWEQRSWEEIRRDDPEEYRLFQEDPGLHGYAGGENMNQVLERVAPEFAAIAAENRGRTIAIVGHNVVNRAFLSHVLGVPMSKARTIHQENCCVNVLLMSEQAIEVTTLNAVFHLY